MSAVIHHGSSEGFLSTQSASEGVPLQNALSTAVLHLPHYHHQMVWQHSTHLAFKGSFKNQDENKLLETAR